MVHRTVCNGSSKFGEVGRWDSIHVRWPLWHYEITTAVQRSALRLAWTRCQAMQAPALPPPGPSASTQSEVSASQSTWSETYPPKLTSEVVSALKQKFKRNYPAEILLPEATPSLRLLSLIHHQKLKGEYKWVPWKYRLSQAKTDEITAVKPNRIAKSEGLQLHALLVDSPPELHIDNGALGMHALRQTFETFSYAIAMCEIVYLATMKNYYLKFINLMTTRLEAETGLRNPTILEAQGADKTLMTIACELVMEKQWSFDDAIHEVTCIRAEINTLLQARPRLPRQTYQRLESGSSKGSGKNNRSTPYGKGKTGKSSGKASGKTGGKVTWITETSVGGSKKQLCMRFQSGKCDIGAPHVVSIIDALSPCHQVRHAIKIMEHWCTTRLHTDHWLRMQFKWFSSQKSKLLMLVVQAFCLSLVLLSYITSSAA